MRKNKALLKRAASLFTAFVILAGSATYAQEEQTSQEVLSQEILSESSSELSEELVNGTTSRNGDPCAAGCHEGRRCEGH